jgi:hypothetical protein
MALNLPFRIGKALAKPMRHNQKAVEPERAEKEKV